MPGPADVHMDAALTDFSVAVGLQASSNFVARRAFPAVSSPKQSDRYFVYTSADLLRSDAQRYSGKGPTAGRDYGLSEDTFFIEPWAVHYDVGRHERANADTVLDPEEDAARILMQDLLIREDQQWAATAFITGVWGTSNTPSVLWDDIASTPIENHRTGILTVEQNTGHRPNKVIYGAQTWSDGIVDHPDILDRIKYSSLGVVTENLVAQILEVDEVIVGHSIRNTAAEGLAASNSFNLGTNALLLHVGAGGPRTPTAGRTFTWDAYGSEGILTERFDIPEEGAYPRIQSFRTFDHKITSSALGYAFIAAVT